MAISEHATDVRGDRRIGEDWERRFRELAEATGHGWVRRTEEIARLRAMRSQGAHPLPDVTIGTPRIEHHEIKHKAPTSAGEFGLEVYRFDAMLRLAELTSAPVLYTIHDWRLCGARSSRSPVPNRLRDWRTADIQRLADEPRRTRDVRTYWNSAPTLRPAYYWSETAWLPLADWWDIPAQEERLPEVPPPVEECHVCGSTPAGFVMHTLGTIGGRRRPVTFRYCDLHVEEYRAACRVGTA